MTFCGKLFRLGAGLTALFAVFVGCLFAGVPGQLGLWRYADSFPQLKGIIPLIHDAPWGFNHSTLGPDALKGRTYLVTGANQGLGLGTVHYLAVHGADVILGCRNQKNCEEAVRSVHKDAPHANLVPLVLDLESFQSIKHFADQVIERTPKLHSLILNAGTGNIPFGLTEDGLERQIGLNHFGHAYLVQLLQNLLKQTASKELPATIVVVSSASHWTTYPEGVRLSLKALNDPKTYETQLAYGQSKLANVLYAQELAQRLRPFGILVNSVHPGAVETKLLGKAGELFKKAYPIPAKLIELSGLEKHVASFLTSIIWNPKDGALTQVYAAVSPEIISNRVHGKYFHPVAREVPTDSVHANNATLQKAFWDFTEEVLKAKAK